MSERPTWIHDDPPILITSTWQQITLPTTALETYAQLLQLWELDTVPASRWRWVRDEIDRIRALRASRIIDLSATVCPPLRHAGVA